MNEGKIAIIGRKIGMSQFFKEDGTLLPITLVEAPPCPILQIKTKEKDGYTALQLGFGEKPERLINKPAKGHLKKSGAKPVRTIKEIRLGSVSEYKEGQHIDLSIFQEGDFVDVTGISIGKGFQGGVKRWHWTGGKASHGSMHHRQVGSVGASSFPSRIMKGHHMPGRMGAARRNVQNLEIIKIDKEKNLLAIKGALPGNENSYLVIKESRKRPRALEIEKAKRHQLLAAEAAKEVKKEIRPEKKKDEKKEAKTK